MRSPRAARCLRVRALISKRGLFVSTAPTATAKTNCHHRSCCAARSVAARPLTCAAAGSWSFVQWRYRSMKPRLLEIRQGVLSENDKLAANLRARFEAAGVFAVNFVSSPGAGKTTFLEATLSRLRAAGQHAAALVGDLETDNDARRLAASGAPVRQITTSGNCHLEAHMIERFLDGWNLNELDYLFI